VRLPFVISVPHCSGKIPEGIRADFVLSNDEIADSIDLGDERDLWIFGGMGGIVLRVEQISGGFEQRPRAPGS